MKAPPSPAARPAADMWELRLYVAGQTPKGLAALANLKMICDKLRPGQYHIKVIDLVLHPELAGRDQILAIPTLVRVFPKPVRKILGDLSDLERVRLDLDL